MIKDTKQDRQEYAKIAHDISQAREDKGMTVGRLAAITGIPLIRLRRLEKSAATITMGEMVKIADTLDFQFVMTFEDNREGVLPEENICGKCSEKCSASRGIAWGEDGDRVIGRTTNAKVPMGCIYYLEHLVSRGVSDGKQAGTAAETAGSEPRGRQEPGRHAGLPPA